MNLPGVLPTVLLRFAAMLAPRPAGRKGFVGELAVGSWQLAVENLAVGTFGLTPSTSFMRSDCLRPSAIYRLQDQPLVAGAAGDLFAVEVFEEGDGVFA